MTTLPDRSPPSRGCVFLAALLLASVAAGASQDETPAGPLSSDPPFEALATDGTITLGRIRSFSPDGRLVLVDDEGDEQVVGANALVKLSRIDRSTTGDVPDATVLVLPDGDQLRGLIDSADERAVAFRSAVVGDLAVPLDSVLGFTIEPPRDERAEAEILAILRDPSRTADLLMLVNGDRRRITFSSLGGAELAYLEDDRSLKVPREAVRAVGLDPGLVRRPEVEGLSFDLILTDGSRLRLVEPSSGGGRLSGKTTFGSEVGVPFDRIADLYVLGGSAAFLSDLEAVRERTIPYVGPSRPTRPNASVLGGPLTVGGRRYLRGLGTQSQSLLVYRLSTADRRFQASVAMDDAAGPLGNAAFRVLVDSEERFASPPMSVGDDPRPVDVDVSGGQFLILATEFGRGGGVRDFAAWIEPRLIRDLADSP